MTKETIKEKVIESLKMIAPDTDPEALAPNQDIRESLNIDSFDSLQFLVTLGKELGIDIPEEDYGKTTTMKNLLTYLEQELITE